MGQFPTLALQRETSAVARLALAQAQRFEGYTKLRLRCHTPLPTWVHFRPSSAGFAYQLLPLSPKSGRSTNAALMRLICGVGLILDEGLANDAIAYPHPPSHPGRILGFTGVGVSLVGCRPTASRSRCVVLGVEEMSNSGKMPWGLAGSAPRRASTCRSPRPKLCSQPTRIGRLRAFDLELDRHR